MIRKIVYFFIMFLLFLGSGYLIIHYLGTESFVLILVISLTIAVISDRVARWFVNILFADNKK